MRRPLFKDRFNAPALISLAILALAGAIAAFLPRASGGASDRSGTEDAKGRDLASTRLERGSAVFARYCAGCHGTQGDGQGEVAAMLYPRPRDLVEAELKFSSRRSPELPTDADLMRLLERGLKGTAMPSFRWMPESDRLAVIGFIKTLSPRWKEEQGPPVPISEDPWAWNPEAGIEAGDKAYHIEAMCMSCHPSYHTDERIEAMYREAGYEPLKTRLDAHLPVAKENPDGTLTIPQDFKRDWIKSGSDVQGIYLTIAAGITTTQMPTWVDSIEPEMLWGLAHYVAWLARQRPYRLDPSRYVPRPAVDLLVAPETEEDEEFFEE